MSRRFTGVTDTNDRKIYTGDTVKMHYFRFVNGDEYEYEVIGIVGGCWGKNYTEREERTYIDGKLVTYKRRYYWDRYLELPSEELEIIGGAENDCL